MNIIVTGGAGFIASHVVSRYIDLGHKVAIVDNLSTGKAVNIDPRAIVHSADICDRTALQEIFNEFQPEVVNHHAAQIDVRKSVNDPVYDASVNVLGGLNVLCAAHAAGTRKIIYASTGGAIYGEPDRIPAPEDTPIRPLAPYGVSKHHLEHYLDLYSRLDGIAYTVLRYANVYGPRQDPLGEAGVNAIFTGLMTKGEQPTIFGKGDKTRDYIYVGDVVEANVLALERGDGEILNIGTGIQTSDQEVFETIANACGYTGEPLYAAERKGEVRHVALDATRARQVLGWQAQTSYAEGVHKTIQWYLQNTLIEKSETTK